MFFRFSLLLPCLFTLGCSQLTALKPDFKPRSEASDTRGFSPWYRESLYYCELQDQDDLHSFELPVQVDLWDRVRDGFALEPLVNRRIQHETLWYARHPSYMARVSARAEKYLFYIVEELERRQMPTELALLPIVESAFDPFAYSHGRASGMWQIIPGTGRMLGLKQNWWYDGRRDVVASTHAALDYLERLHRQFDGDWLLALAAYNSGAGTVSRAIRRNQQSNKPTDYWSLGLPRETQAYVPRLLALKELVSQPDVYELAFYPIANQPYFTKVKVDSQIDLAQAAEWAELSMEEFYALNPGFNRWATDPEGPHRLLVPTDRAERFVEQLHSQSAEQRVAWDLHEIRAGDSLSSIATRYRTTVSALQAANQLTGTQIRIGRTLLVPRATANASHYSQSLPQRVQQTQSQGQGERLEYTVKSGDSLWAISRRHKVTTQQLARWNAMAPGDPIRPGQKLVIWTPSSAPAPNVQTPLSASVSGAPVVRRVAYQVRRGDSLARIANRFNVRVSDIVEWNQVNPNRHLQPGQQLTLFVDVTSVQ